MPWRSYVDPSNGQTYWTDGEPGDAGANYLTDAQYRSGPGAPVNSTGSGGGGQRYVAGMAQLDPLQWQLQQEYQRQRLRELELPGLQLDRQRALYTALQGLTNSTGYVDPGAWQQLMAATGGNATGGNAPAGSYQTVNGPKTLQQMRDEVVSASGGMQEWRDAPDDRILAEYGRMTGGQVTPGTGSGGGGTASNPNATYQQMIDWEIGFKGAQGRDPTRQEWGQRLSLLTGMNQQQGESMFGRLKNWQDLNNPISGEWRAPDAEWQTWMQQVAPQRTLERQRFEDTLAEQQRQYNQGQQQQNQQYWASLLSSQRGPRDYWVSQLTQANMPESVRYGDMAALARNTPQGSGMTPSNNSWEQTYANWLGQQRGTPQTGQSPTGEPEARYYAQPIRNQTPQTGQSPIGAPAQRGYTPPANPTAQAPAALSEQANTDFGVHGGGEDYWRRLGLNPRTGRAWQPGETFYTPEEEEGRRLIASWETTTSAQAPQGAIPLNEPNPQNRWIAANQGSQYPMPQTDWRGAFTSPNQMSQRNFNRMTPSQREMLAGQYSAYGVNPEDAFEQMRRSWQGGQANSRIRWS